ncbi:YdcF family protein [Agitococcus lubricus]|uniref:Uncharacterized SAM-binding protein YcdF (DUF218 family) n=1 Tax=Agitococcus lubricus TaxID=1077255 RepID=A0A2T5J1U0_9GAMM|nr:YdcF family protein [Agitococcus lubricus]PTQ90410.1 uncharacterized SAM-binding protein YcdF (DUF218 family) [Agitococcus lubricus]
MKTFFSFPFLLMYSLLVMGLCWHYDYKKTAYGMLLSLILGIYLLCTPLMTRMLQAVTGTYPPLNILSIPSQYQALVILGGGIYRGDELNQQVQAGGYSLSRLRYGAHLARATQLPVLLSGVEAPALNNTLIQDFGVMTRWQEDKSRNTDENARFSAALLHNMGIKDIILVTDSWHMGRAKLAFEHYGFKVLPAPTDFPMGFFDRTPAILQPKAALFMMNLFGLSECLGQIKYRLQYL